MALFSRGVPRLLALGIVMAGFCVLSPEALSRGPDLCLWRHLLHLAACPACGSTRALAAFFHGRFRRRLGLQPKRAGHGAPARSTCGKGSFSAP